MRITALAGGVGGARFLRGLLHHLDRSNPTPGEPSQPRRDAREVADEITVIANTGDDITLHGLRVSPDVDTLLYTLGGGVHEDQGWGRAEDSTRVAAELRALGSPPDWFTLGDLDMATHIARSHWLGQGLSQSEVIARLAARWGLPGRGVTLLPMTDTPVETHVVVDDGQGRRAVHFQEWWVRMRAAVAAEQFVVAGLDRATPAPGVLDALRSADVILLPPSNPVVSIGVILGVPGVRDALRGSAAPVIGVSPLIAGRPVRGHADACLSALGLPSTSEAVAGLYEDFLDGWLVDPADAGLRLPRARVAVHAEPLLMTDVAAAGRIAAAALDLAGRG